LLNSLTRHLLIILEDAVAKSLGEFENNENYGWGKLMFNPTEVSENQIIQTFWITFPSVF